MNFKVINGVETVELTAAERRALEKALPILDVLSRKADDESLKQLSEHGGNAVSGVLKTLDAQAADTDA